MWSATLINLKVLSSCSEPNVSKYLSGKARYSRSTCLIKSLQKRVSQYIGLIFFSLFMNVLILGDLCVFWWSWLLRVCHIKLLTLLFKQIIKILNINKCNINVYLIILSKHLNFSKLPFEIMPCFCIIIIIKLNHISTYS